MFLNSFMRDDFLIIRTAQRLDVYCGVRKNGDQNVIAAGRKYISEKAVVENSMRRCRGAYPKNEFHGTSCKIPIAILEIFIKMRGVLS